MSITGEINLNTPKTRNCIADFLTVVKGSTSETCQMGTGFNSLNESFGAQEESKGYINDQDKSQYVKGYERSFAYDCDLITSEKAIAALLEVGERGLTGTDAMFEYHRVDLFRPKATTAENKEFYARRFIVTAVAESAEGAGTETVATKGTLKSFGGMSEGWFDMSTKKFTADPTAASTAAYI